MSSFSTFSPSFEQTYCCFRRAPSFLCSQLNEIAADDSPAENILIGTETRPKEIVAEPMECAGTGPAGGRGVRGEPAGRELRRGGGARVGPRRVGAPRRSGSGARPGQAALRTGERPAAERVTAREAQEVVGGLPANQGAGRLYLAKRSQV